MGSACSATDPNDAGKQKSPATSAAAGPELHLPLLVPFPQPRRARRKPGNAKRCTRQVGKLLPMDESRAKELSRVEEKNPIRPKPREANKTRKVNDQVRAKDPASQQPNEAVRRSKRGNHIESLKEFERTHHLRAPELSEFRRMTVEAKRLRLEERRRMREQVMKEMQMEGHRSTTLEEEPDDCQAPPAASSLDEVLESDEDGKTKESRSCSSTDVNTSSSWTDVDARYRDVSSKCAGYNGMTPDVVADVVDSQQGSIADSGIEDSALDKIVEGLASTVAHDMVLGAISSACFEVSTEDVTADSNTNSDVLTEANKPTTIQRNSVECGSQDTSGKARQSKPIFSNPRVYSQKQQITNNDGSRMMTKAGPDLRGKQPQTANEASNDVIQERKQKTDGINTVVLETVAAGHDSNSANSQMTSSTITDTDEKIPEDNKTSVDILDGVVASKEQMANQDKLHHSVKDSNEKTGKATVGSTTVKREELRRINRIATNVDSIPIHAEVTVEKEKVQDKEESKTTTLGTSKRDRSASGATEPRRDDVQSVTKTAPNTTPERGDSAGKRSKNSAKLKQTDQLIQENNSNSTAEVDIKARQTPCAYKSKSSEGHMSSNISPQAPQKTSTFHSIKKDAPHSAKQVKSKTLSRSTPPPASSRVHKATARVQSSSAAVLHQTDESPLAQSIAYYSHVKKLRHKRVTERETSASDGNESPQKDPPPRRAGAPPPRVKKQTIIWFPNAQGM